MFFLIESILIGALVIRPFNDVPKLFVSEIHVQAARSDLAQTLAGDFLSQFDRPTGTVPRYNGCEAILN